MKIFSVYVMNFRAYVIPNLHIVWRRGIWPCETRDMPMVLFGSVQCRTLSSQVAEKSYYYNCQLGITVKCQLLYCSVMYCGTHLHLFAYQALKMIVKSKGLFCETDSSCICLCGLSYVTWSLCWSIYTAFLHLCQSCAPNRSCAGRNCINQT